MRSNVLQLGLYNSCDMLKLVFRESLKRENKT